MWNGLLEAGARVRRRGILIIPGPSWKPSSGATFPEEGRPLSACPASSPAHTMLPATGHFPGMELYLQHLCVPLGNMLVSYLNKS